MKYTKKFDEAYKQACLKTNWELISRYQRVGINYDSTIEFAKACANNAMNKFPDDDCLVHRDDSGVRVEFFMYDEETLICRISFHPLSSEGIGQARI